MTQRRRLMLFLAASVLLAGAAALLVQARDWTEVLEQSLSSHGRLAALGIFCLAYVVGTLLLVPAWIFPIAAGAAFGLGWGVAASLTSSTLAAACAFLLGRHVLRDHVERAARRNETFRAVDKAVKHEPVKVVALLRLSPALPSGLKSYFLGLTCVKPLAYVAASAAGMLPGVLLKVYLGDIGRHALDGHGPWRWAFLAAGAAATLGAGWLIARFARKRLGF